MAPWVSIGSRPKAHVRRMHHLVSQRDQRARHAKATKRLRHRQRCAAHGAIGVIGRLEAFGRVDTELSAGCASHLPDRPTSSVDQVPRWQTWPTSSMIANTVSGVASAKCGSADSSLSGAMVSKEDDTFDRGVISAHGAFSAGGGGLGGNKKRATPALTD